MATKVSGRCVEMVGGAGFVKEFPIEKFYRDSKIGKRHSVCFGFLHHCVPLQARSMKAHPSSS